MEELVPIAFFFSIAAVMILRPITKRLGLLLEALARERQGMGNGAAATRPTDDRTLARVASALEQLNTRLELLEDRMEFVERLSDGRGERPRIASLQ